MLKSLLILAILPIFFISAAAETHINEPVEIFAQLDKTVYYQDEKIYVTGEVSTIISNPNLSYQVRFDEGNTAAGQILITEDKQINITLNPGPMWSHGNYTLILNYLPAQVQIPFQFFNIERPIDEIPEPTEELPLDIQTNKPYYIYGDTVTISGTVPKIINTDVSLIIRTPGNELYFADISVSADRTFQHQIHIDELFEIGTYTIGVIYDGEALETSFENLGYPITFSMDKSKYNFGSSMIVEGIVAPYIEGKRIDIQISKDETIKSFRSFEVTPDRTFSKEVHTDKLWESGEYEIRIFYNIFNKDVSFQYVADEITIQTDKQTYHNFDTIHITGDIYIPVVNNEIKITIYDDTNNVLVPEKNIPFEHNLFDYSSFEYNFTINDWGNYNGDIIIEAVYEEYTENTTVHYSSYPSDLSIEFLYDIITNQSNLIILIQSELSELRELIGQDPEPIQTIPVIGNFTWSIENNTVNFSWIVIDGEPIDKYMFQWRNESGSWDRDIIRDGTITSWSIENLSNIEYEFKFHATNNIGNSEVISFTVR